MVRVELSEDFNRLLRKYSDSTRKNAIKLLDELVMGKVKVLQLRGKLSRFASLRLSRELFIIVRYVASQRYVVAYSIARRESLVEELRRCIQKTKA